MSTKVRVLAEHFQHRGKSYKHGQVFSVSTKRYATALVRINPHVIEEVINPVGYWIVVIEDNEMTQYGIDGDTVFPHQTYPLDEAKYFLSESCMVYIMNVFANGQIRLDEVSCTK